jgi:selenide, water dikinase
MPGVRLTLVARELETPYSGMLPGLIAGHYRFEQCHIDLAPLARFAGARLIHAEAIGLDLRAGRVLLRDRPPLAFDFVSLDTGITPALTGIEGAAEHAVPVKPIGRFLERWRQIEARASAAGKPLRITVIGAGAGGVELLLAAQHGLARRAGELGRDVPQVGWTLIGKGLLAGHPAAAAEAFARVLAERRVEVLTATEVVEIETGRVICDDGRTVPSDVALLVTDAAPPAWLAETGLPLDRRGFIAVDACLRSPGDPRVFAAGDVAAVLPHPRPKAGVFAVRQGPPLTRNLRHAVRGERPIPFRPQRHYLSLISTGDRYAIGSRGPLKLEGAWLWHVKDRIDRRFMRRYQDLPPMPAEGHVPEEARQVAGPQARAILDAAPMRCGGCGAKIGASILERVLRRLQPSVGPDLILGLDAPDDAALIAVPPGMASVQTIDFFRAFIDDPFVLGQVAAVHALNDIYAMAAEPRTALALATIPFAPEPKLEEQLYQLMAGALSVFEADGVSLAGGHSSEGAELGLGFAVHGLVEPARALRKAGLRVGDRLILTKALGTGTLFAAAMRGRAQGPWLSAALAQMRRSAGLPISTLRAHGATACTDVSGFGLIGHLAEMLQASRVGARLDLEAVPALDGALDLLAAGVTSSLQLDNLRRQDHLGLAADTAALPRFALLFDPQTAGGLLAGVPAARAGACVAALRQAGETGAAIIGEVVAATEPPIAIAAPSAGQATHPATVPVD